MGLHLLLYGFTLWFGLYLLARNFASPGLRSAGGGLVAYALALGFAAVRYALPLPMQADLRSWQTALALLPTVFWVGAAASLLPALRDRQRLPRRPLIAAFTGVLFFALSISLILLSPDALVQELVLLALSVDLVLLGVGVLALDAYDEGEALLPDALRSLGLAALTVLLFGGQAALLLALEGAVSPAQTLLLFSVVSTAVGVVIFAPLAGRQADRLMFARTPQKAEQLADLRAAAAALPRQADTPDFASMDDTEFSRLTRRALGHMGDLNRLAANPLMHLPLVTQRLHMRGAQDNTLERAAELKLLLAESIERLKPRGRGAFGTTDEWRFYNALYFPYVLGLKPFSSRPLDEAVFGSNGDSASTRAVLDWFRAQVPERTLHNWQNAAARLIAQDLREQMGQGMSAETFA